MAPPDDGGSDRAWRTLALSLTALTHGAALGNGLLDGDRLLLVRNPPLRSFAGLATLLGEGRVLLRGAGLQVRDRSPIAALSTWLSWEWFRAHPAVQHAVTVLALVAVVAALGRLLRSLTLSPPLAWGAALAVALAPCAADLTGPLLGRDPMLALLVALLAARRAQGASVPQAAAWSGGAALAAGLCAPGYGLLGLLPAAVAPSPAARRVAAAAVVAGALAAMDVTRGPDPLLPTLAALGTGAVATLLAWLPSPSPFVALTLPHGLAAALVVPCALAIATLVASVRARDPVDATLLRAASAFVVASTLAAASAVRGSTGVGTSALLLQLSLALAAVAAVRANRAALTPALRPWMLVVLAVPAAFTAHRVRRWSDQERVLHALVARDPDDAEALLARAEIELLHGRFAAAAPWCLRYGTSMTTTGRADGCVGALAAVRGDERAAVFLLRRWAGGLDDRRALRAAALRLSDAVPDPRFGTAFRAATGYSLPQRRPREPR